MTNDKYQTGARHERTLANHFREEGWYVCRSAGSGTAQGPSVDLVCLRDGVVSLVECKTVSTKSEKVRVSKDRRQAEQIAGMIGPANIAEDGGTEYRFILSIAVRGERSLRFVPLHTNDYYSWNDGARLHHVTLDNNSAFDFGMGGGVS